MSRRNLNGWVFDVIPGPDGMTVWFRAEAGETVSLSAPFRPSFVLAGKNLKEATLRTASARWNCSLARGEGTGFFSGRTIPAWTFTVAASALLGSTVRKAEKAFGPEALFNADIAPEQQFAYATGLYPLSHAHVECDGDGTILSSRILDAPWDIDAPRPFLSTALLRTEGKGHPAHGRIRPLEFTAGGITHVLQWEDGAEFLRELLRLLKKTDPDLLVTEYGDDYLLPRLLALAGRLRIPLPLGRPRRAAADDAIRRTRERSYLSYGRVVFLAAPHTLSGRWHVDARNSFLFGETGLPGLIELARLSGIPLQRLARTSPGTAISAMQVATALRRGILVPYKKREPEEFKSGVDLVVTDKGGLTYLPRPGLHENVGELDFASMYPSLMDRYNISPETINCGCCRPGIPVPEIGAHTCVRRRGLVPDTIAPILSKRRLLKERQAACAFPEERELFRKRQTALKWLLVVCFGFLGYRNARFGRIEAHEAVTAWGREKLLAAKEIAESCGFLFLHGLTDAIWVKRQGATAEDYRELAERITEKTGMPIALEGVYRWLAFLPSKRNPKVAVPNRFAGAFSTGEIKARGIAMRRSDTPPMVAALQRELLERMAAAETIFDLRALLPELREIVRCAVAELFEGRIPPEALAVARRLSKAPEQYVANTAAAAVTRELCGRGVTLRPGSKIRYLLADGKGRAMGFLDGNETPDFTRYEEMLREAEEELLGLVQMHEIQHDPSMT
ncbi:MAG: DNA polymerase domain-containing protein [Candidatus Deferrimicrobiota bacterium]